MSSDTQNRLPQSLGPAPQVSAAVSFPCVGQGIVERVDLRKYRNRVIDLYERNGRLQSSKQFDWYCRDQGQEAPFSWTLRDGNGKLAGICSVTVRPLQFGATSIRAGVAGNLLLDRTSRIYLGAFSLVRAMKSLVINKDVDVLLGVPNRLSQPIFVRLGFQTVGRWETHVQIFHSRDLLRSRFGSFGSLASPLADVGAVIRRSVSGWSKADYSGFRVLKVDESEIHGLPLEDWAAPEGRLVIRPSVEYLKMRFLRDPIHQCQMAAIVASGGNRCGYLVLRPVKGRVWVTDCRVDHQQLSDATAILCFCHEVWAQDSTVWITHLRSASLSKQLGSGGFIPVRRWMGGNPDLPLVGFWLTDHPLASTFSQPNSWNLFPGFNDV